MSALVGNAKESLMQAVDAVVTQFGIHSWDFLPYEAVLIIMAYLFGKSELPSRVDITRLRQWFWRAAFSQRYRVGGENFVSKDLTEVSDFVIMPRVEAANLSVELKSKAADFGSPPRIDVWKKTPFRATNSISIAYILGLASLHPRNLTNGAHIDVASALSHFNRKEFHHIYPKNYLKAQKIAGEHNALANICMLAASENKLISDRDPREYIPECVAKLGAKADLVFKSNLMPMPSTFDYATHTFSEFIERRSNLIENLVSTLCAGDVYHAGSS